MRTGQSVAIKISPKIENISVLMNETRVMLYLIRSVPIPKIRAYGEFKDQSRDNYLVMDLLGDCLTYENVCKRINKDIPPSMTSREERMNRDDKNNKMYDDCNDNDNDNGDISAYQRLLMVNIYTQLISIMEGVHEAGLLYRDVKPENFLFGLQEKTQNKIHLVDFGLVKRYTSNTDHTSKSSHMKCRHGLTPIGTTNYMSVRVHLGVEASRRDDMESLAYLFYYLQYGELPWMSSHAANNLTHAEYAKTKREFRKYLAEKDGADNILRYLNIVDTYTFEDCPNYQTLRNTLSYIVLF